MTGGQQSSLVDIVSVFHLPCSNLNHSEGSCSPWDVEKSRPSLRKVPSSTERAHSSVAHGQPEANAAPNRTTLSEKRERISHAQYYRQARGGEGSQILH